MPDNRRIKLEAKRHNERWKLTATLLNTLAAATVIAAFITPYMSGVHEVQSGVWLLIAAAIHWAARMTTLWLRSED